MASGTDTDSLLAELQRLNELQRVILEGANLSIIATDTDGIILSFNRAAEQMLGYSAHEIVGKITPSIFHDTGEVLARASELSLDIGMNVEPGFDVFVAKTRLGLAEEREWTYIRKDGSRLPVLLSVTALRDGRGLIQGYLGIGMDITSRKERDQQASIAREHALGHEMIQALTDAVICIRRDAHRSIRFLNMQAERLLGISEADAKRHPLGSFIGDGGNLSELLLRGEPGHIETTVAINRTGACFAAACSLTMVGNIAGEPVMVLTVRDISARRQTEQKLRLSDRVFEHSSEAIMITDAEGLIVSVNPAFTRVTGYESHEAIGCTPRILKSDRQDAEFYRLFWKRLKSDGNWSGEIHDRRKDGSVYPKWMSVSAVRENGEITHYVAMFNDITERKRNEERISHLAYHDTLTGLPNRLWLSEQAAQIIARAQRTEKRLAVIFIDLDRFKNINDSLGHHVGDQLLVEVARRLQRSVRAVDSVVRLGGDEFVVIAEALSDTADAARVATNLHRSLERTIRIGDKTLHAPPRWVLHSSPITAPTWTTPNQPLRRYGN